MYPFAIFCREIGGPTCRRFGNAMPRTRYPPSRRPSRTETRSDEQKPAEEPESSVVNTAAVVPGISHLTNVHEGKAAPSIRAIPNSIVRSPPRQGEFPRYVLLFSFVNLYGVYTDLFERTVPVLPSPASIAFHHGSCSKNGILGSLGRMRASLSCAAVGLIETADYGSDARNRPDIRA